MWQGKYIRWNPIPSYEGTRLYCEAIHDDWEGFRIWLRGEKSTEPMIIVRFDNKFMYVNSDEGDRLSKVESDTKMNFPHAFWTVEGSALIDEFHRQSLNMHKKHKIVHFAFLTCNDCIDVLSDREPVFHIDE